MSDGAVKACAGRNGFAKLLGTMMTQSGETFTLIPTDELVGNPILPALHGGAIASFLELAAQLALSRAISPRPSSRLISVNLQFLAPVRPVAISTTPTLMRVGRRVAVVHAEAVERDGTGRLCHAQLEFALGQSSGEEELTRYY
ncbi:PaaI family thioesterase [Sphingomonas sp. CCH5-D11]|jgi:acyl-coenzyme A thioesterase PaaI-like protein|uniref:PaaI family thioesterase n=1 Tax=Sphingomonas sp. CCH5-D11 TaxID=1768786 RepID=UPI000835983F|nr:PaaI family thioesterase [Sphingomonas sp. CCH5-D11]